MAEKFVLMSSLEPLKKGDEFEGWPLHVTIMPWFFMPDDKKRAFENALSNHMHDVAPVQTVGGDEAYFGPDKNVRVRILQRIGGLALLHGMTLETIQRFGGVVDSMDIEDNYVPHVTYQGDRGIDKGQTLQLDTMQLVSGDTDGPRTVERTFNFLKGRR